MGTVRRRTGLGRGMNSSVGCASRFSGSRKAYGFSRSMGMSVRHPSFCGTGEGRDHITCLLCRKEFQAITSTHLFRKHEFDPSHPVLEYKRRFGLKVAKSHETLRRAKAGISSHFERLGRRWTRARVKRQILESWKLGKPLNSSWVAKRRQDLMMGATHLYGSWARAIIACGLPYERVRLTKTWSRNAVLDSLRRIASAGRSFHASIPRREREALQQAGRKLFGSWDAALGEAGVDPEKFRKSRRWSRAAVVTAIRKLPGPLRSREARELDSGLVSAAQKLFGKWCRAVRCSGMTYPHRWPARKWPRPKILETIRDRARRGRSVTSGAIESELSGLWEAGSREFGSWKSAVLAAGVEYPEREWCWKWPPRRVLGAIRKRIARGLSLRAECVRTEERGLVEAARRAFGTWAGAVRAAGEARPRR